MNHAPDFLTTVEAAEYLRVHPGTLANWRCYRNGPPYERRGRSIRYERSALDAWRGRQTVPA